MIRKMKRLAALLLLAVVGLGFATTPAASTALTYVVDEGPRVRDYASCRVEQLLETMPGASCSI